MKLLSIIKTGVISIKDLPLVGGNDGELVVPVVVVGGVVVDGVVVDGVGVVGVVIVGVVVDFDDVALVVLKVAGLGLDEGTGTERN